MQNIKTFSQLKRDLKAGTKIKTILNNIKPEKNGQIRTIQTVQTNAICFDDSSTRTGKSWLYYPPKAKYIKYYDNIFEVYDIPSKYNNFTSDLIFKYEILNEGQ